MRPEKRIIIAFTLLLLMALGCSGGNNPVTPDKNPNSADKIPIFDPAISSDSYNAIGLFGAYELSVNPQTSSAELISKRAMSIGESYIVNGASYFTIFPCSSCLKIKSISMTIDGDIKLTFYIHHPMSAGDPLKPPSATNRLDLNVFDLAAVLSPRDTVPDSFPLLNTTIHDGIFICPDGYTRELANLPDVDDAALPYYLVIDETEMLPIPKPTTWNRFAMGQAAEFDILYNLSGPGTFNFDLYLTMGYGLSAKKFQRLNPKYYNPEFNRKPAWKVDAIPPQGTDPPLWGNTWRENDTTSFYSVSVQVYDWQIGALLYEGVDYSNANKFEVRAASYPSSVSVEILGMTSTPASVTQPTNPYASGRPGDFWLYKIPIANENNLPQGEYPGLVKVTDQRLPGDENSTFDLLTHSPDGISKTTYLIPEYATYQTFTATVLEPCGDIQGEIVVPTECPNNLANGEYIRFVVSATSGNGGGNIAAYEVDYNYNGSDFTADYTSLNGVFNDVGPFSVPDPCNDNIPFDFTVAFRATDSCIPPNRMIFATCKVTVNNCLAKVGNVSLFVNRIKTENNRIDSSKPWSLSWFPASGAAEYAVYVDKDPSDGLDNNFELVDVVSPASPPIRYNVPAEHYLDVNGHVPGYTYCVRARTIAGDPSSELGNSQLAHVIVTSFDTLTGNSSFGYPDGSSNTEGWKTAVQRTPYAVNPGVLYWPNVGSLYYMSSPNSVNVLCSYLGADWTYGAGMESDYFPGHIMGETIQTPDVPNSNLRRLEFLASCANGWDCTEFGGVIIGWSDSPTQPADGWDASDFHWVKAYGTDFGFQPYNWKHENATYIFPFNMADYTSGPNSWRWEFG